MILLLRYARSVRVIMSLHINILNSISAVFTKCTILSKRIYVCLRVAYPVGAVLHSTLGIHWWRVPSPARLRALEGTRVELKRGDFVYYVVRSIRSQGKG